MLARRTHPACKRRPRRAAIVALTAFYSNAFSAPGPNDVSAPDRSQLEALRTWSELKDEKLAAIAEEESRHGPLSRALIDPLVSLGLAHQEYGEHDLAVEALSRALQIKRVNDGLYGLDQVPLLRQLSVSELALGDFASAAMLDRRIMELARLSPDDPRSVEIFRAAGDRRVAAYESNLAGKSQMSMAFGTTGSPISRGPAPAGFSLWEARRNYTDALHSLLRTQGYSDSALPELERALIRTYYLELSAGSYGPERAQMLYYLGRESYRRLVAYSGLNDGSVLGFATALVELADWDLLFSHNARALERYEHAHAVLVAEGVPESTIRAIFSPEIPVLLPAFLPSPFEASASRTDAEHIDVAFELGKYGTSRRIEILSVSANTADGSEKGLVRLIASNRFRPRLERYDAAEAQPYQVRYYVNE
jgi:tetratricopeptide (TPR) repeat protein